MIKIVQNLYFVMKLEILSFGEALKYEPKENSYGLRIEAPFDQLIFFNPLKESENWVKINRYDFNDMWPKDWKEYGWIKPEDILSGGIWNECWNKYSNHILRGFDDVNYGNFVDFLESEGHPSGRYTLFDENMAKKILDDFEEVKNKVDNIMIHCMAGKNRSPAVGIAMNNIYGWGIKGLEEKFPLYRKYVYDVMMKEGRKVRKIYK